jgi:hypothetical protein
VTGSHPSFASAADGCGTGVAARACCIASRAGSSATHLRGDRLAGDAFITDRRATRGQRFAIDVSRAGVIVTIRQVARARTAGLCPRTARDGRAAIVTLHRGRSTELVRRQQRRVVRVASH